MNIILSVLVALGKFWTRLTCVDPKLTKMNLDNGQDNGHRVLNEA